MSLIINEIHPNQQSGSEWIEFLCDTDSSTDLSIYSVFDAVRKIYQFSSENCTNDLLSIEVSGLNNDTDSVVLKTSNGEIIDQFSYLSTEKGMSWARMTDGSFILTNPSRDQINPLAISQTPSTTPTTTLTTTPTPNSTPTQISAASSSATSSAISKFKLPYDATAINLQIGNLEANKRESRLVILGQSSPERSQILGVIMASCLILFSAIYLLYVKKKSSRH